MDEPFRRPSLGTALFYKDPFAALDWLASVAVDLDLAAVNLSLGSYSPTMCSN